MKLLTKFRRSLTLTRIVAMILLITVTVAAFSSVYVPGVDPYSQNLSQRFIGLGQNGYLLGSDELGRDVLSRVLYGFRIEIIIAFSATCIAMVGGTVLGLVAGYYPRLGELLVMRVVDVILSFPPVIVALLAMTIYGHSNFTLTVVIGVLYVPNFARVVYGQVLTVANLEFVEAARVFGAGTGTRIFRVILPNCLTPIIVQFTVVMALAILVESGLSFLGLGVVPPEPSLGTMVAQAQRYMSTTPELLLIPAAAISGLILAIGVLGDFLRDLLDPRT